MKKCQCLCMHSASPITKEGGISAAFIAEKFRPTSASVTSRAQLQHPTVGMAGLDDLTALFHPLQCYDSVQPALCCHQDEHLLQEIWQGKQHPVARSMPKPWVYQLCCHLCNQPTLKLEGTERTKGTSATRGHSRSVF